MRKFQFPLDGVRRLRTLEVRRHEVELARAREALAQAESARERTTERLAATLKSAPRGRIVHVRQALDHDEQLRGLRHELEQHGRCLADGSARVETQRTRLIEARRGKEAVEKLRERRYIEFLQAVLKEDQKIHDEVASRVREHRAA